MRDIEFAISLYEPLVVLTAEFLDRYRDPVTGLPLPSYDLWEEQHGVFTFTVSAVYYAGLVAASRIAALLGDRARFDSFHRAAVEVQAATLAHLYDDGAGLFTKVVRPGPGGRLERDLTVDASAHEVFTFGLLPPDDSRVIGTMRAIEERLRVKAGIGGIARYERDESQRADGSTVVPGNPWPICTLWLAEWYIGLGDLPRALELLEWVCLHATPAGLMAEQLDPFTGAPLSVAPLTLEPLDPRPCRDPVPRCGPRRSRLPEVRALGYRGTHTWPWRWRGPDPDAFHRNGLLPDRRKSGIMGMDEVREYSTRVIGVVRRSERTVSVRFERPEGFSYLPGQFMFITLTRGDERLTRHLTISSSPTEPVLEVTKGLTGHPFANTLATLVRGDEATIRGPYGTFTLTGEEDVVLISGGIGVTPLRSMIRYATDIGLLTRVMLLYSAQSEADLLFGADFAEMERRNPRLSIRITLTRPGSGWTGPVGRIDRAFIENAVPDPRGRVFFISGPKVMVDAMVAILKGMDIPDEMVRREYFPGY